MGKITFTIRTPILISARAGVLAYARCNFSSGPGF